MAAVLQDVALCKMYEEGIENEASPAAVGTVSVILTTGLVQPVEK